MHADCNTDLNLIKFVRNELGNRQVLRYAHKDAGGGYRLIGIPDIKNLNLLVIKVAQRFPGYAKSEIIQIISTVVNE